MLYNSMMILGGLFLLGGVSMFAWRKRNPSLELDEERSDRDVAPVLYVPRPRNTSEEPQPENQGAKRVFAAGRVPTTAPVGLREAPLYVAPLSDQSGGVVQLWPGRLEPVGSNVDQE